MNVNMANIRGIIQSMVLLIDCCLGSGDGMVDIFCNTHIVPPQRMARINQESGRPRLSQRKLSCNGTIRCIIDEE
jgi:hypothetical protein